MPRTAGAVSRSSTECTILGQVSVPRIRAVRYPSREPAMREEHGPLVQIACQDVLLPRTSCRLSDILRVGLKEALDLRRYEAEFKEECRQHEIVYLSTQSQHVHPSRRLSLEALTVVGVVVARILRALHENLGLWDDVGDRPAAEGDSRRSPSVGSLLWQSLSLSHVLCSAGTLFRMPAILWSCALRSRIC